MGKSKTSVENLVYYFKAIGSERPVTFFLLASDIFLNIVIAVIIAFIPSALIGYVTATMSLEGTLPSLIILTIILAITSYFSIMQQIRSGINNIAVRLLVFSLKVSRKYLTIDFETIEKPSVYNLFHRALDNGVGDVSSGTQSILVSSKNLCVSFFTFIIFALFLSYFNVWAFVVTVTVGIIDSLLLRQSLNFELKNRESKLNLETQRRYLKYAAINPDNSKDARIYNVSSLYMSKVEALAEELSFINNRANSLECRNQIISTIMIFARDCFVYSIIIHLTLIGSMTITEFSIFLTVMGSLNGWMRESVQSIHEIRLSSLDVADVKSFIEYPSIQYEKSIVSSEGSFDIEFRNVSYCYPDSERNALSNVSFTLNSGDKLALVGTNGSGKSTLVKLLLGLIRPTEGVVTLNGLDINTLSRDEYFSFFSPVFQDVDLWALSLEENVSLSLSVNRDALIDALTHAGLIEFVNTLPNGFNTNLTHYVHRDGVNLSGGQIQKIMLARAIYKNAPILVLDEPTSALDAIAEQSVYEEYYRLSDNKSSLFISHRLASTRFCDRIILLDSGRILEEGTHDDLMMLDGEYASMFALQRQYYEEMDHEAII
ncbi:ABC transporter ATP-binding protein [Erysipelothrix aquatica]|uniref:ABC transporter ATP-binding protein n=1 Tax=Erysipelothrix aquatica TaxID=2683714 RepID=UPI001356DE99|nr:ABC transporter ATP-binding protein [Erysipelothrix aquatica]